MTLTFGVKDLWRLTHGQKRVAPWIKLYTDTLDDPKFAALPDAAKMHLVGIWLLADRTDNIIPADPIWIARRIGATEPVDLMTLEQAGFIVLAQAVSENDIAMLAIRQRDDRPEIEEETEESREDISSENSDAPPRNSNASQER